MTLGGRPWVHGVPLDVEVSDRAIGRAVSASSAPKHMARRSGDNGRTHEEFTRLPTNSCARPGRDFKLLDSYTAILRRSLARKFVACRRLVDTGGRIPAILLEVV
jgi:hypothetical protein